MNVLEHPSAHIYVLALSSIVLLYLLYYYLFSYYIVRMQGDYDVSKKNLGKSLPPYPNGWYIACKAQELLPATTKPIDLSGHNITLLRSTTGKVFALHAYCSHMGANLGIGGTVVNGQCVQCPFHGWLYDGETGHLVGKNVTNLDHDGKPVPTNTLEYNSDFGSDLCTSVQWKQTTEHASQRVYRTK
jgi:cholesterol 7-dehydrogenase